MVVSSESPPLGVERQRFILDLLKREGVVRTAELCEMLNVSAVTIRSDLRDLKQEGACELIWGGAVSKAPAVDSESRLSDREQLHAASKKRIGERAAQLVEEGQTIILDAGTTTTEIINHLPTDFDYLRVVTPALNVAVAATYHPYIELVMPGGVLRNLTRALVGAQTLRSIELFNADWTFLASGGFSVEHGVTTGNIMEVEVKRTMVQRAARVALVADSSKFGRALSLCVTPLAAIDILVTDDGLSDFDAQAIAALGVTVLRV